MQTRLQRNSSRILPIFTFFCIAVGIFFVVQLQHPELPDPITPDESFEGHVGNIVEEIEERKPPVASRGQTATQAANETIDDGAILTTQQLLRTRYPRHANLVEDKETKDKAQWMCDRTFWHTLTSTTKRIPGPTGGLFIFTGDIGDMWVRDSAAQVHLYIPLARKDAKLRRLISDLINRTAYYITIDPYANSFSPTKQHRTSREDLSLGRYDYVTTYNYELDSGCYFLRLLYTYWKSVGDARIFRSRHVRKAVARMVELWTVEQYHHENRVLSNYMNPATKSSLYRYPELSHEGKGTPVGYTGMTWSGFRPSDDACAYGYLVPANMFASATLGYVVEMATKLWKDAELARSASKLKLDIDEGIRKHAIVDHPKYGKIYAYEVDGLGHTNIMDDANVPSLLSIPYLGFDYDEQIYANTRKFALSVDNPNYRASRDGKYNGIGSEHMRSRVHNNVWPMAQAMQGLTSDDPKEKLDILSQLLSSDGGTGWMHESYDVDNPKSYTRAWFCWADALFAEFVLSISEGPCGKERPLVEALNDI